MKKTHTTAYHPESDGLVERFNNRTLIDMLSMAVSDNERDWDLPFNVAACLYRTSRHETTGTTPFFLMFGRDPRLPEDVMYSLPVESYTSEHQYCRELKRQLQLAYARVRKYSRKEQLHQKEVYNRHVKGDSYHVNDMVLLHCPAIPRGLSRKFHKPWQGPYRVVKIIGPTVYRIADCTNPRKKKVVHFNRLKRAPIGKVPELANGKDMVEGARNDMLPVGPVPGNRNGNDLVEDSLEEETVGMPSTEVTDQAPKGPIAQVPGPPEEILPAPVAQVPGQPAPAAVRQSTRQTRPPVRYGDPISLPDDVVTCGDTLFKRRNNATCGARRLDMYMLVLYKCVV